MRIAQNIRWWRTARGMSQARLAHIVGVSQPYMSQIENGKESLDSRTLLERISAALDVPYAELAGYDRRPETPNQTDAHGYLHQVRLALLSGSLEYGSDVQPRPLADLRGVVAACADAWQRCDYAGSVRGLGPAISELYALARAPEERVARETLVVALDTACYSARVLGSFDLALGAAHAKTEAAAALSWPWQTWAVFSESQMTAAAGAGYPAAARAALRMCDRELEERRGRADDPVGLQSIGMLHLAAMRHDISAGGDGAAHLAEATALAERTGEGTAFRLWFGPTNVAIWEVHAAELLSDQDRLVRASARVDLDRVPSEARKAMYLSHLAIGLMRDPATQQEGVRALLRSERVAPGRLRLDPLVCEAVEGMLYRARAAAGSSDLRRLARHVGVPL